jgi:hypothetical protein
MSQNQTQLRASLKRLRDLGSQISQLIQSRGIGFCLVRDQRSAEFEKDQFSHMSVLPQTE